MSRRPTVALVIGHRARRNRWLSAAMGRNWAAGPPCHRAFKAAACAIPTDSGILAGISDKRVCDLILSIDKI